MQVAVLSEPGELSLRERPQPDPAADEVLVRMGAVGICGSDLHYYEHGRIGDYVVESPLVLGHESAGEVAAVGKDVTDFATGDRVALEPGVPCGRCAHCRRGEYNLCPDVEFMATPPDDGALAEYVAWPADFAYRLPDSVSLTEGALCEPLSVGVHVCRRGDVGPGDDVAVTGYGPIGLLAMDVARARGASDVVVADPVGAKRQRAIERGADLAVDPTEENLGDAVREHAGRGADVVIEASGADAAIQSTVDVARRGGTACSWASRTRPAWHWTRSTSWTGNSPSRGRSATRTPTGRRSTFWPTAPLTSGTGRLRGRTGERPRGLRASAGPGDREGTRHALTATSRIGRHRQFDERAGGSHRMTREYDKLVRDRIPEIIEDGGEVPIVHEASDDEYERRLVDKLREAVEEYGQEADLEELADVLEVVHALRKVHGVTEERLESIRARKANEPGRFEEGIVLERVEEQDSASRSSNHDPDE